MHLKPAYVLVIFILLSPAIAAEESKKEELKPVSPVLVEEKESLARIYPHSTFCNSSRNRSCGRDAIVHVCKLGRGHELSSSLLPTFLQMRTEQDFGTPRLVSEEVEKGTTVQVQFIETFLTMAITEKSEPRSLLI